jgi:hypothetical protein
MHAGPLGFVLKKRGRKIADRARAKLDERGH